VVVQEPRQDRRPGEATSLHTQHQRQVDRAVESRSAPGSSEVCGGAEAAAVTAGSGCCFVLSALVGTYHGIGILQRRWFYQAVEATLGGESTPERRRRSSRRRSTSDGTVALGPRASTARVLGAERCGHLNRLRVRSIDEVGYVAQDGEHLKGLTGSRFGPAGVRHQIADAHESTADQGGRTVMS
jgi:hypothetical protein